MRPWVLHTCHSTTSSHLGVSRTLSMLRRFYWWIGMDASPCWWLRRCLKCQARKTSRQTIRWPTLSLSLPTTPASSSAWATLAPYPSRLEATPTSSFLRTASAPHRLVRHYRDSVHRLWRRRHPCQPIYPSLGMPRNSTFRTRTTGFLQSFPRHLRPPRHQ